MTAELVETSWRRMRVSHPADWEMAVASGLEEPGRCAFADRHYQRLDVRWCPVTYVPNLDLILTKYRQRANEGLDLRELTGAPSQWRGLEHKTKAGWIAHAGRFFREVRWLTEVTIVWPGRRDRRLENQILESIHPESPQADPRLWQAMGLSVVLGRDFELHSSWAPIGRVRWVFRTADKHGPELAIERLAMPDAWLDVPLRDWLAAQVPLAAHTRRQEMTIYNSHRGERLITWSRAGRLASLRGRRKVRLDMAWLCPVENRLYRISLTEVTRDEEVSLPGHLAVRCCRPVPAPGAPQNSP